MSRKFKVGDVVIASGYDKQSDAICKYIVEAIELKPGQYYTLRCIHPKRENYVIEAVGEHQIELYLGTMTIPEKSFFD